jgi:hypothetical protein
MDRLFTSTEEKLAEFMASPKAQGNNRFMSACAALDVFLKNGRIVKAEQAAGAQQVEAAAQVQAAAAAQAAAQADADAEYYKHEAHIYAGEAYAAVDEPFNRVFLENYLNLFYKLEDNPALQADVAADLLTLVRDSPSIQPALLCAENVDLLSGVDEVMELMKESRAAEANARYQAVQAELQAFMAERCLCKYDR